MVTTIQVSDELKNNLKQLKQSQTYEEFLTDLIKEHTRLRVAESMQAYGKEHAEESLKEVKEWEHTETPW